VTTIGVCEDDAQLRSTLTRALRAEGFEVVPVATGAEALRAFGAAHPDVVVLDLGLPDVDGRDVCLALKANGVTAPVLMLTARDGVHHRVAGFEAGADDYLGKPFALAELMARLRVLERRSAAQRPAPTGVVLDPGAHAVVLGGTAVALTPTEFKVLGRLMAVPGEVVRRRTLVAAGWPDGAMVSDNTLDSYIRRIRTKLAGLPDGTPRIETVHGVGYTWR
jgi:two-component system response regulator MprA